MNKSELLSLLAESKKSTIQYFELDESALELFLTPDKWSIKEILIHLSDAESILLERIKRIIAEPKQVIWAFNQELWASNLDYKSIPLTLALNQYCACRDINIYLCNKYFTQYSTKEFVHNETGIRTLGDEMTKIAEHNVNHLKQIKDILHKNNVTRIYNPSLEYKT